jgi:phosphosulfolactate phosphohydrolase-like enzyme
MLINELVALNNKVEFTDSSIGAMSLYKSFGKNIFKMLSEADHGRLLMENGFKDDLKACAELDSSEVIPFYSGNALKELK